MFLKAGLDSYEILNGPYWLFREGYEEGWDEEEEDEEEEEGLWN